MSAARRADDAARHARARRDVDRSGPRPAATGLPGRDDLQDPVPGGRGPGHARSARASGYRRFTAYDCARLRFVLTAQRDQYLPLKVIKAQLDAQPDGELPRSRIPSYGVPRLVRGRRGRRLDAERPVRGRPAQVRLEPRGPAANGPASTTELLDRAGARRA